MIYKYYLVFVCLILSVCIHAQDLSFTNESYIWPDKNKIFEQIPDSFKNEDAIILNDELILNFSLGFIKRRQAIKILNADGLNYYKSISLPQNFDITKINNSKYKQGRLSKITLPYVREYKISYFACRILRKNTLTEIPVNITTNKIFFLKYDGTRLYDYEYIFDFNDLDVGDVIEYTYKLEVKGSYDTDQFYVQDYYPKLKSSLLIDVLALSQLANTNIIFNHNIDSTSFTKQFVPENKYTHQVYKYHFKNVKAIKYSQNCIAGKTLPHITANIYNVNRIFFNETMNSSKYLYTSKYIWFIIPDSLINKEKIYNKSNAILRKYLSKFPDKSTDTSRVEVFSQITDSLNRYKFVSAEEMHYGKDAQYTISSYERLLKHQLTEEFLPETYENILFEKNIFYYRANVQDRRYGYHSLTHRAHQDYELSFIAIPVRKSFKYFMPAFDGVTYYPDELPFYCEGTYCALFPKNTKATEHFAGIQDLKFIKTPISTFNENIRTENAIFKVNIDSNLIRATIKENLNGQFSTILRHYYNNEIMDSTIKIEYLKKCTNKPKSYNSKITLSNQLKTFPFKASYNCTEQLSTSKDTVNLANWFSFLYQKENFSEAITHDYYLDFTFTDIYNYLFEFNKPVTVENINEFNNSLRNDFFEIHSTLIAQENNKYLLSITTKAKQYVLPLNKADLLKEYVTLLHKINNLKLILKK